MTLSPSKFRFKTLAVALLSATLAPSIGAMENIDEKIEHAPKEMSVVKTKREELIDIYTFHTDLLQENPEINTDKFYCNCVWKNKEMNLFHLNLISLPQSIGNILRLETLNINNNNLAVLPNEIGLLTNLTYLGLKNNHLKELPTTYKNLTNLKMLGLSDNKISFLPAYLTRMIKLETIQIDNNQLTDFPKIDKFTELKELSLCGNQIEIIPEGIGQLSKLECLHINDNKIRELPRTICHLPSLKRLCFENTDISRLPLEMCKLKGLNTLILSNNIQLVNCSNISIPLVVYIQPFFNFYEQMSVTWEQNILLILALTNENWCYEMIGIESVPQDIVRYIQKILIALTKQEIKDINVNWT